MRLRDELGAAPGRGGPGAPRRAARAAGPRRAARAARARSASSSPSSAPSRPATLARPGGPARGARAAATSVFERLRRTVRDPPLRRVRRARRARGRRRARRARGAAGLRARPGGARRGRHRRGDRLAGGAATGAVTTAAERLQRGGRARGVDAGRRGHGPRAPAARSTTSRAARLVGPRDGAPAAGAAPLVGRAHELAALEALYARGRRRAPPAPRDVVGQAGIGKSRLVDEFVEAADTESRPLPGLRRGHHVLGAAGDPRGRAARIVLGDSAAAAAAKLRALVERAGRRRGRARDVGAGRQRRHRAAGGPRARSRRRRRSPRRSGSPGRGSLSALGARRWSSIEDLHWAEPPLLDMVEAIVGRCRRPAAAGRRPRVRSSPRRGRGWGYRPGMSQVVLQPLERRRRRSELVDGLLPARDAAVAAAGRAQGGGQPVLRRGARAPPRVRRPGPRSRTPCARCSPPASTRCRADRAARAAPRRGRRPHVLAAALLDAGRRSSGRRCAQLEARGFVVPRATVTLPGHTRARVRARAHARGRVPLDARAPTAAARTPPSPAGSRAASATGARSSSSCSPTTTRRRRARPTPRWRGRRAAEERARRGGARARRGRRRRAAGGMAIEQAAAVRRPRAGARRSPTPSGSPRSSCEAAQLPRRGRAATRRSPPTLEGIEVARRIGDRAAALAAARLAILLCVALPGRVPSRRVARRRRPALVEEGLAEDGDETGELRRRRAAASAARGACAGWRAASGLGATLAGARPSATPSARSRSPRRSAPRCCSPSRSRASRGSSFDEGHGDAAALGERQLHAAADARPTASRRTRA